MHSPVDIIGEYQCSNTWQSVLQNAHHYVAWLQLGGTVGDIESMAFIEAFRQFEFRVKRENFCNIHVSLVPTPKTTGEQKTKPTQKSLHELRGLGLVADMVSCADV